MAAASGGGSRMGEVMKKMPRLVKQRSAVDKEEMSRSSAASRRTPRKKASSASVDHQKVSPEIDSAVADFVEYHTNPDRNATEYEQMKAIVATDQEHQKCCQVKERNRYETVPCLDASRVVIQQETPGACDFIHANRCKFENVARQYIIAQAPMKNTFEDFWRMIFQEQVSVVIVLCDFYENGKEQAEGFWPMVAGQYTYHGKMFLNNKKVEPSASAEKPDIYVIEVLPDGCSNSLMTTIYHSKWPSASLPQTSSLLKLYSAVKAKEGPVTVVSSQGIGRAPLFVAVDAVLDRLFKGHKTRLLAIAKEMRRQRAQSLYDQLQYVFVVQAILRYIKVRIKKHAEAVKKFDDVVLCRSTRN